jgi:hypothetical protein
VVFARLGIFTHDGHSSTILQLLYTLSTFVSSEGEADDSVNESPMLSPKQAEAGPSLFGGPRMDKAQNTELFNRAMQVQPAPNAAPPQL